MTVTLVLLAATFGVLAVAVAWQGDEIPDVTPKYYADSIRFTLLAGLTIGVLLSIPVVVVLG